MQSSSDQSQISAAYPQHVAAAKSARLILALFVVSLLIPSSWEIAGLRLDTMRIFALCMVIPLALRWLAQEAGRILPVDVLIILYGQWIILSLMVNHGLSQIAISGMTFVEMLSGFLVGRILIRDASAFKWLFQMLLVAMAVLLPFALYEMATERAILQDWFRKVLGSAHGDIYHPPRMGLYRAQTVMQHPILWGMFCSITIANAFYIWSDRLPGAFARFGLAWVATFSSVSSGAVLGAMVQAILMLWGWATKGAWKTLAVGFAGVWVLLSLASNRGPIVLMVTYLTFSPHTGWGRIHIWNNGIDDALANPIFGIGLHDWSRPFWMGASVDNFWLLTMMRHGFVGFGLLAAAIGWHIWKVASAEGLTPYQQRLRQGYLIGFVGLIFGLATVHFWGPPYTLMFTYIGAGVWFYTRPAQPEAQSKEEPDVPDDDARARFSKPRRSTDLPFARSFSASEVREPAPPLSRSREAQTSLRGDTGDRPARDVKPAFGRQS